MKKNLLLIAALCCALFSLTACGGDDEPANTTTTKYTVTYTLSVPDDLIATSKAVILRYKVDNNENDWITLSESNKSFSKSFELTSWTLEKGTAAAVGMKLEVSPKDDTSSLDSRMYNILTPASIKVVKEVYTNGSLTSTETLATRDGYIISLSFDAAGTLEYYKQYSPFYFCNTVSKTGATAKMNDSSLFD